MADIYKALITDRYSPGRGDRPDCWPIFKKRLLADVCQVSTTFNRNEEGHDTVGTTVRKAV